jgi:thiol-disulfide isomerase/thioredoxin
VTRRCSLIALAAVATALPYACVESPYVSGASAQSAPSAAAPAAKAASATPEFVRVGDAAAGADAVVRDALKAAGADARTLVVYVGATWCEPCKRFHEAVERGELDRELANVRFLEFDADAHGDLLDRAGYGGKLIPRFVRPGADGRGGEARIEGGTKGDGAVKHIMARLGPLLAS